METFGYAAIILLVFLSVGTLTYVGFPFMVVKFVESSRTKTRRLASSFDTVLMKSDVRRMAHLYLFGPIVGGIFGFLVAPPEIRLMGVILGLALGFIFPGIYLKQLIARNRRKFDNQLVDALLIMSSSFRGGLSLVQAIEAVVEEMPDPVRQEFGTVLGENKMGVALEESLNHLYSRVPSPALQQMITAILLARETGGNLPVIFGRIVGTIRETKKIEQNIETLTLQGKIQGAVMSLLPVAFLVFISATNPRYMQTMMNSEVGRLALMAAAFLEIIGVFLIWKISKFKDY